MVPTTVLPPIRLLITDRQPSSRDALLSLLRGVPGFQFVGAFPPEQAVQQAALRRVNVVLLDVRKPHDATVRLCRELCALSPRPTVIALTSFGDAGEERALRDAGTAAYLLKEINCGKLVHAIRQLLAREWPHPPTPSPIRQCTE